MNNNDNHVSQLKQACIKFFYYWWNEPGNNTEQGFDKWIQTEEGKQVASQFKSKSEGVGWISVKDRLPETDCIEVVVLQRGIDPEVMTFFLPCPEEGIEGHRFYKSYRKHWDDLTEYVTHWQPLPSEPEN